MSSKEGVLYHQLFLAYKGSHANLPAQMCQQNASDIWKMAKEKLKNKEKFIEHLNDVIRQLKMKATEKKATMLSYFTELPMKTSSNTPRHAKAQCSLDFTCSATKTASSACSSHMESIVAVTGHKSTVKSQNTDEEIVQTPSTEPHTTLIDSGFTKNVTSKSAQDTLMIKISHCNRE